MPHNFGTFICRQVPYTYGQFSAGEVGQIVGDLSEQVLGGVYFSEDVREVKIPKKPDSDKYRTLKIGTLCDRVLGSALDHAFKDFWKARFLPWSYGFRPKMSAWRMLADLEVTMQMTGLRVLAIDDLKNAFDNVPVEKLIGLHGQALKNLHQGNFSREDKKRTPALIESVLRGPDKTRKIGIDQGNPYSPTGLNVLMHYHHDLLINKEIHKESLWFRYADNLAYLTSSVSEGWQTLSAVSSLLQPLGMTLKGEDGVKDLAHGEVVHLMGFSLWWEGNGLQLEIEPETLKQLRQRLAQCHVTPNPPVAALVVAQGWIEAYAPAFEDGDVSCVLDIITEEGFREGISLITLKEWWKDAWTRWQKCRRKALRYHRGRA